MQLSDISSQKLAPGRYLITASYDGDVQYNPAEAQLVLVIDANGEASYETRPIDDDGEMQVVKVSPNVQFTPSTISIVEKNLDKYPFNWKQYFSNPYNVGYSSYVSTGLTMYADETIGWEASGTYVLTIITNETELYTSQTITLTMNVTSKVNPRVEYVNDNEQFTLENGNFTKRYRNIEKREGVYMFDLLQPTNPYSLPLKYKIDDDKHGTIDVDGNKIYISAEGKYKITAYYEGDDTYRSSITYYILKYYEGEEPVEDEPNPQKISPNLSFVSSNVTQDKNDDNRYKVLQLINPYNVSGGTWVVSKGNITSDGKTITYDGIGSISVSYIYNGNNKYLPQIVTYILNINSEDNPDNLPVPDIGFTELIVTVDENEAHEYQIQYAYNNSGVAIDYYYNGNLIENGILKTTSTGNLTIMGQSKNNGTFAATKIYYTLQIVKYQAKDPEISFDTNSVKEYQTSNFEYLLQFVSNPHNVELVWSSSKGVINDNILYCEELGTVIITVKSKPTFYYLESTISYTLEIEESPKLSPELSFDEEAQFFNANSTLQYPVQAVNNPHNVELRWFSDRGELNSEMSPTILTISYYSGPVNIYCKSVEDETYKSEVVTYKLFVGAAKKYLQYTKHEDYDIERNQGTFDLEMLRYAKSQDLEFDPSEWTFTSSLTYCTIEEKYYVEDGDDIVVMAKLRFTKQCNPLISISFAGNDYFYNTSGIRVHVNLLGKKLLSPEISFSDSYQLVDINTDYRYLLQDVENPHNVEIVYSASAGTVEGNYLIYQDKYNVIVKATSVENDTYESQTISYKLEFKEAQKPSSGIHFAQPLVEITQTNDGIYELQGLVDAEDNPIADTSTLGYYSANIFGDITYDENRGCYIIENEHFTGNATIRFIIYETQEYRKETISYVLKINSNQKASPELAFAKYQINVTQKSDGIYQIQELINPHSVPVTWFCSKGEFDDPSNPQTISFSGRDYISIGVQSQETETYAAQRQSYGMTIMLPSKRDPGLTFDDYQMTTIRNDEGIYPLQRANNPNNVSPLTYSVNKGTIEGDNIIYDGIGMLTITVSYAGDDVYNAVNLRYTLDIGGKFKKYLEVENCQSVEMTGELNEDIEVQLVRWNANKEYTYNPSEWTITSSHFRCTYKTAKAQEINGYVYLIGTFSFKSEGTAYITISFKGNDDFQNDEQHGLWIEYTVPTVVDNRVLPSISFNNYMLYVTQTTNYMYLLQSLNKPDDVEIDHWELDYGGSDFATAKIIDDEYVYYEGTDYVHVKVYTKESEVYKQATDGYDLYVNEKTKTGTSIIFTWDNISANRRSDGIYSVQSVTTSPANLPLTWTSSKGELINNNTQLRYSDVGEVTITCSFAGDNDYEASTSSYKIVISEAMAKRYLQVSEYKSQTLEVALGAYYDIPIIKWPLSEGLEFDADEWYLSNSYSTRCVVDHLFTEDDGEYRILKARCSFTTSGSTYLRIRFLGNDYFYDSIYNGFTLYFNRDPEIVLIDPKISWPEEEQTFEQSDENKYLLQTPVSEYQDVVFNDPKVSRGTLIKENGNFYVEATGLSDIVVSVKNLSNNVYTPTTISYTIKLIEKPIVKQDSELSFANSVDNVEYVWRVGVSKYYKIQPVHNPYDIPILFNVNKNLINGNSKTYLENGYIDYDCYVEVDGIEDVTINAVGQENDYYYITSQPSYTMHIQRTGQVVDMYFEQELVNYSVNSNGYHKLQEVMLSEEIADIRNNILYNVDGTGATIKKENGVYYLVTNTPNQYTIRATYQGNGTYASNEATYVVNVNESVKNEAPIYFSEDEIYTLEQESNIYPLQMPLCSDNSFDFDSILVWGLPTGWSLVGTSGITTSQSIEDDTILDISCSIPETENYYSKTIHYTLTIQAKVHLSVTVHDNYVNELKEFSVLEQEILRWPVSQNIDYIESEWSYTCQTYPENDVFTSSLTHHVQNGYHIISLYYLASFYGSITVNVSFAGNFRVHPDNYGLYITLNKYIKPESEKDDPEIRWTQGDYIEVDSAQNQKYTIPSITNPHSVGYDVYYQQATPKVSGSTITDYTQLNLIGARYSTSGTISFQGEGYIVCTLESRSNSNYYSTTDYIVMYIRKDPNAPEVPIQKPNFYVSSNYMNLDYNEEHKYPMPTIINTDNVEYHIYSDDDTEIFPENGYITFDGWGDKYIYIDTVATETFYAIRITVKYNIKDPRPVFDWSWKIGERTDSGNLKMQGLDDREIINEYDRIILGYRKGDLFESYSNQYIFDEVNTPDGSKFHNMQVYIRFKTSDYNPDNWHIYYDTNLNGSGNYIKIGPWRIKLIHNNNVWWHNAYAPILCRGVNIYKEGEYTYLLPRLYLPKREEWEKSLANANPSLQNNVWNPSTLEVLQYSIYNISIYFDGDYNDLPERYQSKYYEFYNIGFARYYEYAYGSIPWQGKVVESPMLYSNELVTNLNNIRNITWKNSRTNYVYWSIQ